MVEDLREFIKIITEDDKKLKPDDEFRAVIEKNAMKCVDVGYTNEERATYLVD